MTDVTLQPEPTFEAPVAIHVPGKGECQLNWTYKFKNSDELDKLRDKWSKPQTKGAKKNDVIGYILDIASGWELAEDFTRTNLEHFFRNYPTSSPDVISTYFQELAGARRKN